MPVALPRPVALWLQTLDLTYSIKNPVRDFSNGFLIAEILERYFGSEVPLHSITPGMGLGVKKDNWNLISHILVRKNVSIREGDMDDCINQRNGGAVSLISQLYRVLAKRSLPQTSAVNPTTFDPVQDRSSMPNYTKLTAAFKVKDPSIERTVDDMERKLKRVQVICDLKTEGCSRLSMEPSKLVCLKAHIIPSDIIQRNTPVKPTLVHSIEALLVKS